MNHKRNMRSSLDRNIDGFTLVELLIVIVIIAILAAVSIVAYNGIQVRANTAVLESDVSNYSKQLVAYNVLNGGSPRRSQLATMNDGKAVEVSKGTSIAYESFGEDNYCMILFREGASKLYVLQRDQKTAYSVDDSSLIYQGLCTVDLLSEEEGGGCTTELGVGSLKPITTYYQTCVGRNSLP